MNFYQKFIPVFGIIVMLIFGWNFYQFLVILPGWMQYLTFGEIFDLYSVNLQYSLIDSAVLGLALIVAYWLMPSRWHDQFIYRASISVTYILIFIMALSVFSVSLETLVIWAAVGISLLAGLHAIAGRWRGGKPAVESIADRSIIFLYLYIPLSVLGVLNLLADRLF
jgi:hypothetical protein